MTLRKRIAAARRPLYHVYYSTRNYHRLAWYLEFLGEDEINVVGPDGVELPSRIERVRPAIRGAGPKWSLGHTLTYLRVAGRVQLKLAEERERKNG